MTTGFRKEADLTHGDPAYIAFLNDNLLPWEKGEKSRPKKRLYYELILGTIALGPAVEKLQKVYADNRPDKPNLQGKRAAIASILLDKDGRPLEEHETSAAISSFAWGVPVALKGDLKPLAQWAGQEKVLISKLREQLIQHDKKGDVVPLNKEHISDLYNFLTDMLELRGHNIAPPNFAIRRYEFYASKTPPEPELLNSFFLEDLSKAQGLARQSKGLCSDLGDGRLGGDVG